MAGSNFFALGAVLRAHPDVFARLTHTFGVTPHFSGIFVATRALPTALLTLLLGNTYHARNIVASVLVMVWAARMAGTFLTRCQLQPCLGQKPGRFPFCFFRVSALSRAQNWKRLALRHDPSTFFQVPRYVRTGPESGNWTYRS